MAPTACATDERFAKGRLGQVLHANGSTQYCHDRFGQVTRKVDRQWCGQHTALCLQQVGSPDCVDLPDGSVADYVRDTQGRISQIGLTGRPGTPDRGEQRDLRGLRTGDRLDLWQRPPVAAPAGPRLSPAGGATRLQAACRWLRYDPVGSVTELKNGTGSTVPPSTPTTRWAA